MSWIFLASKATVCCVFGERCTGTSGSNCTNTQCSQTADHVHIECRENHCTCSKDLKPCLAAMDCDTGKCIESHGRKAEFHCLDGVCKCLDV